MLVAPPLSPTTCAPWLARRRVHHTIPAAPAAAPINKATNTRRIHHHVYSRVLVEVLGGGPGGGGSAAACGGGAACCCCCCKSSARAAPEMLVMIRGGAWLPLLQLPAGARTLIRSWVKMLPARADGGQPAGGAVAFSCCVKAATVAACHAAGSGSTPWLVTDRL